MVDSICEELQDLTERLNKAKEELAKEQQMRARREDALASIEEALKAEQQLKQQVEEELKVNNLPRGQYIGSLDLFRD